jgi:hypothetical protein
LPWAWVQRRLNGDLDRGFKEHRFYRLARFTPMMVSK